MKVTPGSLVMPVSSWWFSCVLYTMGPITYRDITYSCDTRQFNLQVISPELLIIALDIIL